MNACSWSLARLAHGFWKADLSTLPNAAGRWVGYRHGTKDIARIVELLLQKAAAST